MTEPIVVDCEGSAQPGCQNYEGQILCAMCGHWWPTLHSFDGPVVPYHQRLDVLTMVDRGDVA